MKRLIQLSYKVKNKIKKHVKSILQKEDPYKHSLQLFKRGKQNTKCSSTQSNNQNKSVIDNLLNSPQGSSNTRDPFKYSYFHFSLPTKCRLPKYRLLWDLLSYGEFTML